MNPEPYLVLDRLEKRFGETEVLRGLSLAVGRGEIFALLGPSGSGKTTALRLLAGFEAPDAGRIEVDGQEVTRVPPARRRFGMVFQHYALFPHLSVGENVAFGLEAAGGRDRQAVARRVDEVLALVDLAGFAARRPAELSGGQQQRVAVARALAPEPRVLLLDEPLSNLDPALRERTRRELKAAIRRVGITTVLVTHEQEEAFELGDRVGVLHGGRLLQAGRPEELYERPTDRFVATFVGRAVRLPGVLERRPEGDGVRLAGAAAAWAGEAAAGLAAGDAVELVLRPEALRLAAAGDGGALPGEVRERRYTGPVTYYRVALDGGPEVEVLGAPGAARPGDRVGVAPDPAGPPPRIFPREGG